jgi:predicted lipid-binding transport protein (Tim44 family)
MGAGFGQFLLLALVALILMSVFTVFMRRRAAAASQGGAGDPGRPASAPQYNPAHVGNDASARPWESESTHFEPAAPSGASPSGIRIGSGLAGGSWSIPAGFDAEGFVTAARRNFVVLQEAWDKGDIPTLRSMMTDEMVSEIRNQLAEREAHRGAGPNQTDVVMLEAQLLGIEDLGHGYMASVEFSGLIREEPSAGPSPFREVWNMTRTKDGGDGWLVAGVQALQ